VKNLAGRTSGDTPLRANLRGRKPPGTLDFADGVNRLIGRISADGRRVPDGVSPMVRNRG